MTTPPTRTRFALPALTPRWVTLAAALVLGVMALAGQYFAQRESRALVDALRRGMEVHALALRGIGARYSYLPFAAAQQPQVLAVLAQPANAAARDKANAYLASLTQSSGSEALYVLDSHGTTLAASNWNTPKSFVGQNYRQRPYFQDAIEDRNGLFYGVGVTTGEPGIFFSNPVRTAAGVVGVVAVKVGLGELQQAWADARDPVFLTDPLGIVFMGSVNEWRYSTLRPVGDAALQTLRTQQVYGKRTEFAALPWREESLEGLQATRIHTRIQGQGRCFLGVTMPLVGAEEPLQRLGWSLTSLTDCEQVDSVRHWAWAVSGLASALLLLGLHVWRLRERRLREQQDMRRELELRVQERTQELAEAHAFRKSMEDSLLVGMRARDLWGHIIYVNPALCSMTGYSAQELLGRLPPYPYWHPDDMERHWQDNQAALSGAAALTGFESRIRHKDGHDVVTMVYTAPLIDAQGKQQGWMSSVVDITAQKQAQARQQAQDEQLQHAQRLATVGEMASTIAHEISQPLMALSNFASAAKAFSEQGNVGMLRLSLDDIAAQARRAGEVVQRIRGFAKKQGQTQTRCDLRDIAHSALQLLRSEIKAQNVSVTTQLGNEALPVQGDRVLLEQVVLNLVLNAVQATASQAGARQVVLKAGTGDGSHTLRVQDNGPGLSAQALEHLFAPFFTTKPHGMGLGLNICRTIAERHGGRITAANGAPGGAVFTLILPTSP